ncbi:SDR family NAD(P)-dependent oxidoreductase [Streptomyces sp. 2A115]|uniref:SDR family NAD(P)-dependent oxidoreductase n=1 Tax=Streptomyces sp. 2A115 TaxID=3457439 RepID=UPI003FD24744
MDYTGTTALVTGASSGIGTEFARRLASRGADVVLVARREERMTTLSSELAEFHGVKATVIPADLSVPGAGTKLARQIEDRGITVGTLVNNAGAGSHGRFADAELSRLTAEIQLNIASLVELTHHFLPGMISEGTGTVVNVASVTACLPVPRLAVYAATKTFVLHFTEALWYETKDTGVNVLSLSPGPTETGFYEASGAPGGASFQTPAQVVDTAFRVLDGSRRPPGAISGRQNRFLAGLTACLTRKARIHLAARFIA